MGGDKFYAITKGEVNVIVPDESEKSGFKVLLEPIRELGIFGEPALLNKNHRRAATIQVCSDFCEVLSLKRSQLHILNATSIKELAKAAKNINTKDTVRRAVSLLKMRVGGKKMNKIMPKQPRPPPPPKKKNG